MTEPVNNRKRKMTMAAGGKKDNIAQLFFQEKGYFPKMDGLNDTGKSKKNKGVIIQQVEAPKVDYDEVIRENE